MRLLQVDDDGSFSLVEREGTDTPPYAILSHTWGSKEEEVTFSDLTTDSGNNKAGYRKLSFCAEQVLKDARLRHFWIDTCCIDKSSSAELSEAITSMFRWYNASNCCYVYMSDVSARKRKAECLASVPTWEPTFRESRWFKRGWTLQELLAPHKVEFFSKEGTFLGDKPGLKQVIHEITDIPIKALEGTSLADFSVDDRMSWAEKRETSREEDAAYSMLGLFSVSMPALYGEGRKLAWKRLKKEIREMQDIKAYEEKQRRRLMESLRFDQLDTRHLTIRTAHSETCDWLLRTPIYRDWLDVTKVKDHHGFLWIKGKPGTGKSTIMKFALAHVRETMAGKVVIAYFFNARGAHLERSTVGTYRSLLLQLLERIPVLQEIIRSAVLSARSITADYRWSDKELESLLEQAIKHIGDSHVICFIDALDECEDRQIRSMISFFERISQLAASERLHLHVCFSSRHYPEITIKRGLSLALETQEGHTHDITNYVESELKIGQTPVAQKVRRDLQAMASDVFMWVVLVVDILNQEFDRGRTSLKQMERRLREIPTDLHTLFRDILTRDTRNPEELILCIQWVLFARQPLSPTQLYFAVLSGVESDAVAPWDPKETSKDAMRRFLLDASKGLTEITKARPPTIQFIHESVRDFILKDNGLASIWPELESNFEGRSQERLRQCCFTYMSLDIERTLIIPASSGTTVSQQITQARKSALVHFPFLEYAVQNVLCHADAAEKTGISQQSFMQKFPQSYWIRLDNMFEKDKSYRYSDEVSTLYVLAERNYSSLIRAIPPTKSCFEVEPERFGTPFFAAIAANSEEAIHALVDGILTNGSRSVPAKIHYKRYYQDEDLKNVIPDNFWYPEDEALVAFLKQRKSDALMSLAIKSGCLPTDDENSLLLWAVKKQNIEIVEELLMRGLVDVDVRNSLGESPLLLAVKGGRLDLVEILLSTGKVDVNTRDRLGFFPLSSAILSVNEDIVERLLAVEGIKVDAASATGQTPLMCAALAQSRILVKRLLETCDVNVNAADKNGTTSIMISTDHGHARIVQLLLDTNQIEIDGKDNFGKTAFAQAAYKGHKNIVKILLDTGKIDINSRDNTRFSPLMHAASQGHTEVVELLLTNNNVEVDIADNFQRSALMYAAKNGFRRIVHLLVESGKADVEARDFFDLTALELAARGGHQDIVDTLQSQSQPTSLNCSRSAAP